MKTMESHHRDSLEGEILNAICCKSDLWELFDLQSIDFRNKFHRKIFKFLIKLKEKNEEIRLVALANDFDISEYKHLFDDTFGVTTPKDYVTACEKLREDTMRLQIIEAQEKCGDSLQYLDFIETVKQLNTIGTVESFEEQMRLYGEEYLETAKRREAGSCGLLTSWKLFNNMTSLFPGDYCVLGARTSIGKTSFAISLAMEAAVCGQRVLFFSAEMGRKHIFDKIAAMLSQQPIHKYKYAEEPVANTLAILKSIQNDFNFIYAPQLSTSVIRSALRKAGKVDLVIVDYLQLLKDYPRKNDTENLRLGRVSAGLKAMAGEFNCVMFAAAQLNRDSEKQKRKPFLSDLRDSGCIEQDADEVLLLHREERDSEDAELIIAKNRTGQTGEICFNFKPQWSYFWEKGD